MSKIYFEEFRRRVTDDEPYAVFHRKNVSYVAHIHEEIEIGYVTQGTVRAENERGAFLLHEGDLFVFMPDEIHALSSQSENTVEVMRILPKKNDRVDFSLLRLDRNRIGPTDGAYETLRRAVTQMVSEWDGDRQGREMALRKCRYEIFLALLRETEHGPIREEEKKKLANRSLLLRKVNDCIAECYAQDVTLEEIATKCGYSKHYFAHCIKQITGSTFLNFLTLYRLSLACVRLRDGDGTVTQIAFDCGFNNLRAFNRAFRKYYGTTPSEYRKKSE